MSLPTAEIQTMLIARYRGDTSLQGLLGGSTPTWNIFDEDGVSTNQAFPYVVTFPITTQSGTALAMGMDATDTWVQVSVFTQTGATGGFGQARAIAKRIYTLTQQRALDLSADGFAQFFLLFESEQELPQEDGISQAVVHRYHFMTQG